MNNENKIRYLEMIQGIINRMANNSYSIKGWLIAIITAGYIFIQGEFSWLVFLAFIVLVILFALLDANYLFYERKYRALYDIARSKENVDFSMRTDIPEIAEKCKYFSCLKSPSIYFPYIALIVYLSLLFLNTLI